MSTQSDLLQSEELPVFKAVMRWTAAELRRRGQDKSAQSSQGAKVDKDKDTDKDKEKDQTSESKGEPAAAAVAHDPAAARSLLESIGVFGLLRLPQLEMGDIATEVAASQLLSQEEMLDLYM